MSARQASIWLNKIQNAEMLKGAVGLTISKHRDAYDHVYLEIWDPLSGERYRLYTARECSDWLHNRY